MLVHDILSPESDADMPYHERVGPELTHQVWNLADEDIDGDFPIIPEHYPSAVSYTHLTLPTNREV